MTHKEFNEIFEGCRKQCLPNDQAQVEAKLNAFCDKNGKISPQAMAMFTYVETIQYTNAMLYSVLSKVLNVEDEEQ